MRSECCLERDKSFQEYQAGAFLLEGKVLKDLLKPPNVCPLGAHRESKIFSASL